MRDQGTRRALFTAAGAGVLLAACRKEQRSDPAAAATSAGALPKEEKGEDVEAVEDLMREHGVIRRVLVVYRESATRLRGNRASVPPELLHKAATLMRAFGEDYHEKQLEEAHVFPALKPMGGNVMSEVDTLLVQHQRGREITEYVLATTRNTIGIGAVDPLARTLEAFARMYEEHAAREDTIVFPAWKTKLSPKRLDEMGELFEEIEHKAFGKDGFDDAVDKIAAIEKALGFDAAAFTAPAPPKL